MGPRAAVAQAAVPKCTGDGTVEVRKGNYTPVFLTCTSSQADGPAVTRITDRPDHGHLDADLDFGLIYYVPDPGYVGTDSFKAVGTNASGDSAEVTFNFNVTETYNTAPVCDPDLVVGALVDPPDAAPYGHINARKGIARTGGGGCNDLHRDAISFEVVQQPPSGTLTPGGGRQGKPIFTDAAPAGGRCDSRARRQAGGAAGQ